MKKILILEDNEIMAENFERVFRGKFKTLLVKTASEAILKIDKEVPDLILADILLRGHSAFSLLNELQSYADTLNLPIVICSDFTSFDTESLRFYGVKKVFDKAKMSPKELFLEVEKWV